MAGISGVAQFLRNIIATEETTTPAKGRAGSTATTSAKNPPLDMFEVLKGAAAMAATGGVGLLTGCGPTADSGSACEDWDQIRFIPEVTEVTSTADRPITFCLGTLDAWYECDPGKREEAIACSELSKDIDCVVLQPGESAGLSVQPDEYGELRQTVWGQYWDGWKRETTYDEELITVAPRTHCRGESSADVPGDTCGGDYLVELYCGEK